jgi:hypothetical protein
MRYMLRHSAFEAERAFSSTYRPEDKPNLCGQRQLLHTFKSRNDAAKNRRDQENARETKRMDHSIRTSRVRAPSVIANISTGDQRLATPRRTDRRGRAPADDFCHGLLHPDLMGPTGPG